MASEIKEDRMKITEFNTEYVSGDKMGLKNFKMSGMTDVVLLTGPNGAGKTRILKLLNKTADDTNREVFQDKDHSLLPHFFDPRPIRTDSLNEDYVKMFEYVPKNIKLTDWRNLRRSEWKSKAKQIKEKKLFGHFETDFFAEAATSLIQDVSDRYWDSFHPNFAGTADEKKDAEKKYNDLNELFSNILGVKLERSVDGDAKLFGFPIADANLSEGQVILLQLCIELYVHNIDIKDFVIIMDEPENHLHPSAVIEVIDKIKELNPNGQIWIATHSLTLISHFDPDCIWYVENNEAKKAGRSTEKILKGLIGNDDDIEKLRQFTDLPYQFGATSFSAQCLLPPAVAETGANDPQFLQIKAIVDESCSKGGKIRLLDYGAGKGRLISSFAEDVANSKEILDYYAYDKFVENKECCIRNIKKFHSEDAESRYYNEISNLGKNSFDIVLMCNVLHEIDYKEWKNIFNHIGNILKSTGYLLIVEDNRIPIGELPNKDGFLVLNTEQLNALFEIDPPLSPSNIKDACDVIGYKEKNRLMAHLIPAKYMKNVKKETVNSAIESLKEMSKRKIKELRAYAEDGRDVYKKGMEYGFWLNQYANASLCSES